MDEVVSLDRALCLPAPDISALLEGQNIVAISKFAAQKGWAFALYPCNLLLNSIPVEQQYHSYAHTSAQAALASLNTTTINLTAWARCELSTMIHDAEQLEALSCSTVWTKEYLQESLRQRQYLFLAYLRVYKLAEAIPVSANLVNSDKCGKFISLSSLSLENRPLPSIKITKLNSVLGDNPFTQRKQQLEAGKKPLYFELSKLEGIIAPLANTSIAAKDLNTDIRYILGWRVDNQYIQSTAPDLTWIKTITSVGNSSDGSGFEKLVRRSLIKLGFSNSTKNSKTSLDPDSVGGAGGLDAYCDYPYTLVAECKASEHESVPNGVSAQLINLGNTHLGKEIFDGSIKVIFAAGPLTGAAEQAAIGNEINVMRPETLQKLVGLKAQYPGSIDLFELETYLKRPPFGEDSEDTINEYIQKVRHRLQVRSHIIQAIKQLAETELDRKQFEVTEIRVLYNAIFANQDGRGLDNSTIHEMLIELSSPLAGYVGRIQGTSLQSDRFYYLRDLIVE